MNGGWFIKIGQDLGRTTTESTILWGQQQQGVITKPWPKGDLGSGKPKFRKKRYIRAFHRNSGLGRKRQPINMTSQGMSKGNKYPWFHTLLPSDFLLMPLLAGLNPETKIIGILVIRSTQLNLYKAYSATSVTRVTVALSDSVTPVGMWYHTGLLTCIFSYIYDHIGILFWAIFLFHICHFPH